MTGAALHTLNHARSATRTAAPRLVLLKTNERPDVITPQLPEEFESIVLHMQAEIDFLREQLREQERQHKLKDTLLHNARVREQALRAELCG